VRCSPLTARTHSAGSSLASGERNPHSKKPSVSNPCWLR
jgi:hypothetical protein